MPENLYEIPKEKVRIDILESYIAVGQDKKLIEIGADGKVKYIVQNKRYNFSGPEEKTRASFYVELVEKYKYPPNQLGLEVIVPRRKPEDKADIVVYEDEERKRPYIVVECKKDGISKAEINQAVEQTFGNANSLRAKYAILVAGNVRIAFDVAGFKPSEREKNIIADIPIRYGKVIQFKYKKGDPDWDPREADRNEVLAKFQQCHDILWEGGKRNPAEAFDEMSKLMFCKIHDERFITKIGEHYRFQIGTHENIQEVVDRVKEIYGDAQDREPGVFTEPIKAEDPLIYSVVEILQGVSLSKTDLDAKGVAFEHFLGKIFRGEMGQYFTPRTIVEFMVEMLNPSDRDCVIDPACGSGGFLLYALDRVRKEVEQKLDPEDARDRWKDFGLYGLFGIEINSQLARVAMMNMIIHEDGHSNIENNDALDDSSKFYPRRDICLGKYTILMTNPPFGAAVKDREKDYLRKYELGGKTKWRRRQNTEILFIERCLDYLRPGGKMGIVLPDGVLTNSSLQYVRDFIAERAQILAIVSLPQTAFTHYGAGVKASLLFLLKKQDGEFLPENYPIFMSLTEHIGYDATGRPDKNEFPEILKAYRKFLKGEHSNFPNAPLCFVVERGELEGRWEPAFYKPVIKELIERINNSKYPVVKLRNLLKYLRYGTSSPPTYMETGIPFIRATNIKGGQIIPQGMKYMSRDEAKKFAKCQVQIDNVIIVRSGVNTGDCAVVSKQFDGTFAAYDLILTIKDDLNPQYLNIFLNSSFGKGQIERLKARSAQPHLNAEEVRSFIIPLPPRSTQNTIAHKIDEAYRIKKEKETEVERLLNSIDDYILGELGITLPELKDEKCFAVTFDRVKGKRFDPYYYQPKFKELDWAINNGSYKTDILDNHIIDIRYGASVKNIYVEKGIPLLRILNLKPNEFDLTDVVNLPLDKKKAIGRCFVEEGDFLISRSGTLGITAIVQKEASGSAFGSFMIKFHIKEKEIVPFYLSILMNSKIVQEQIGRERIGAIQGNITIPSIKRINIPVPPPSIQKKIAQEVKSRRDRARRLQQETKEAVEKAKEEVERMILGESEKVIYESTN
jgi:type I restriction enzyme M protein